jgi:hypothetical protein
MRETLSGTKIISYRDVGGVDRQGATPDPVVAAPAGGGAGSGTRYVNGNYDALLRETNVSDGEQAVTLNDGLIWEYHEALAGDDRQDFSATASFHLLDNELPWTSPHEGGFNVAGSPREYLGVIFPIEGTNQVAILDDEGRFPAIMQVDPTTQQVTQLWAGPDHHYETATPTRVTFSFGAGVTDSTPLTINEGNWNFLPGGLPAAREELLYTTDANTGISQVGQGTPIQLASRIAEALGYYDPLPSLDGNGDTFFEFDKYSSFSEPGAFLCPPSGKFDFYNYVTTELGQEPDSQIVRLKEWRLQGNDINLAITGGSDSDFNNVFRSVGFDAGPATYELQFIGGSQTWTFTLNAANISSRATFITEVNAALTTAGCPMRMVGAEATGNWRGMAMYTPDGAPWTNEIGISWDTTHEGNQIFADRCRDIFDPVYKGFGDSAKSKLLKTSVSLGIGTGSNIYKPVDSSIVTAGATFSMTVSGRQWEKPRLRSDGEMKNWERLDGTRFIFGGGTRYNEGSALGFQIWDCSGGVMTKVTETFFEGNELWDAMNITSTRESMYSYQCTMKKIGVDANGRHHIALTMGTNSDNKGSVLAILRMVVTDANVISFEGYWNDFYIPNQSGYFALGNYASRPLSPSMAQYGCDLNDPGHMDSDGNGVLYFSHLADFGNTIGTFVGQGSNEQFNPLKFWIPCALNLGLPTSVGTPSTQITAPIKYAYNQIPRSSGVDGPWILKRQGFHCDTWGAKVVHIPGSVSGLVDAQTKTNPLSITASMMLYERQFYDSENYVTVGGICMVVWSAFSETGAASGKYSIIGITEIPTLNPLDFEGPATAMTDQGLLLGIPYTAFRNRDWNHGDGQETFVRIPYPTQDQIDFVFSNGTNGESGMYPPVQIPFRQVYETGMPSGEISIGECHSEIIDDGVNKTLFFSGDDERGWGFIRLDQVKDGAGWTCIGRLPIPFGAELAGPITS